MNWNEPNILKQI